VEFRVLGPLVVLDDRGGEVPLAGTRMRALLGLLVMHVGEVVAVDRLADELWGDSEHLEISGALQTQVSRLRAALRSGGLPPRIETRKPGYVLDVDPTCVDAHRFELGVRDGRALFAAGDPASAADALAGALALWRGDVLAGLDEFDLASAERARLRELRRLAEEDRIDAEMAVGRHDAVVGEVEALVAAEPLRERRTAQLMLALYRSGRQADALRAYQATRELLAEELGIEPGADLRRLEAAILAQDSDLAAPAVVARPPDVARGPLPPSQVPAPLTRLIGRASELDKLEQLVAGHRLVTLVGPGGAGKSRLALEVGRRLGEKFRDGAALVELAAIEDPAAIVGAIARGLRADEPKDASAANELLADLLQDSEMLLLLDNCEHILDEVVRVVATLLGRCPSLTILTTSRQAVGLPGEATLSVPPLDPEAATALFAERAEAAAASFRLDDRNRAAVESVCERLDNLPLAIELAASRVRVFTAAQLAERLHDRFDVVTGGSRGALPRQQTLRAVVDWSYDHLDEHERRVFERLSVFAAGCTLAAAEAVCAGDGVASKDVAEILDRLVDKSLVIATPADDGLRFTMLQTLSEYARERLAAGDTGLADAARRRLAEWLLDQARKGEIEGIPNRASFALRFGRELDNVRAGVAWAIENDPALGVEIAARLVWFWVSNDAQVDGYRALSQGLAKEPDLDEEVHARACAWAGVLAGTVGEIELADQWGAEAIEHARRSGLPVLVGRSSTLFAERLIDRGRIDEAKPYLTEARRCFEDIDDEFGLAYLDLREGVAATYLGNAARAYWLTHHALRGFRRIGDEGLLTFALQRLGECADVCGYTEEASAALEEALERNVGLPGIGRHSQLLSRLARVRVNQGRLDEALALAEEGVALAGRQTWAMVTGMAYQARGRALGAMGRLDEAVADLEIAVQRLGEVGVDALAESVRRELDDLRALARG
jgi:predicted ATPase/DNA-binding SARP family transcriptional activator